MTDGMCGPYVFVFQNVQVHCKVRTKKHARKSGDFRKSRKNQDFLAEKAEFLPEKNLCKFGENKLKNTNF